MGDGETFLAGKGLGRFFDLVMGGITMRNVQLVSVMAFLCVLVMSMGGLPIGNAQVLNTTDTVVVVDAIGTVVGPALDTNDGGTSASVVFQVDSFVVALRVTNSRFFAKVQAFWESSDCSGTPVILEEGGDTQLFTRVVVSQNVLGPNLLGKVFVEDPNATPRATTVQATFDRFTPSGCLGTNVVTTVVDTLEIMDLDALFTPPFHVGKGVKQGAQSYDLNGDGKADLVWRNTANGSVGVWLMNGTKIFSTEIIGGAPSHWEIKQVADVNGDGKADLVWRNTDNGDVGGWLMDGVNAPTTMGVVKSSVSLEWKIQP